MPNAKPMPASKPKTRRKAPRRGRGEGTIFERPDGLWSGEVSLGIDGSGKRIRRTVYGQSKDEVQKKMLAVRMESSAGNLPAAASMTVGRLLDQWLASTQGNIGGRTFEERERLVKNHVRTGLGAVPLAKLNALHVEGFYSDMRRRKVGPTTIRSAADLLSIALNYAVRLKLIPANPSKSLPKPKLPKREMLFLVEEQVREVLAAARESNVFALVALALGTGCRQGELLALSWDDIDLKKGTLRISKSLSQTKATGFIVKEPKTAASRRTITLPVFAIEALKLHRAAAVESDMLSAPVFRTRSGNYLDKKNVLRAFRAVVKHANESAEKGRRVIPAQMRFHDLRHSVASLLLAKGHSLRAVSSRLGHANPTMTLRVYAHCMPMDDAKLADGLDAMIQ
jgi:integrase